MSVNQQQKRAMKRLMQDYDEIQREPVENVSAAPLDENVFEWHCNFKHDDIIYHLLLLFTDNYPYESPSAEFVPVGFQYNSGATKQGKKGTKVCLNIFSDFADIHTEWKDEKSVGWSPGYTVQTILLNVVAFLAETQSGSSWWCTNANIHNLQLSESFSCKDCGHNYKKPFPPINAGKPELPLKKQDSKKTKKVAPKADSSKEVIIDYMSKEQFSLAPPKSDDDLFGYGLIVSGPKHRPSLTTPCEFLKQESFTSMNKAMGCVKSVMKEDVKFFLPMYIHPPHGDKIKQTFENALVQVAGILKSCNPKKTPIEEIVIRVIPNLMSATVVEFSKGTQHTSDNSLNGYFSLHRLLLWALETYPNLQKLIDDRLKEFIDNEDRRTKKACPHIGEWLMLLAASSKYRWQDAAMAYMSESWRRHVMWYVKDDAKLGFLDTDKDYRIKQTFERTAVSRKLLAFQVLFLDIAMPKDKTRADLIKRYDTNLGFPTAEMVKAMKDSIDKLKNVKTYKDWFDVLKVKPLSEQGVYDKLLDSVNYSLKTDGYRWTFWKNAGGWMEVLKRYPIEKKPKAEKDKASTPKGKPIKEDETAKKGQGKKSKKEDIEEPKAKGRGKKAKAEDMEIEAPKPKGRGKKAKVEDVEIVEPKAKGRKRKANTDDMEVEAPKPKGRGKKANVEDVEIEEPKPKGRGKKAKVELMEVKESTTPVRGRGKRKAEDSPAIGRKAKKAR
ncbi:uncharacterized protein [Mytilus edulis]|uniref:uncharacterized protein n=1 Tax=Mytilus edulis TaxID=6550 RepID=UPI0039EE7402